MEDPPLLALRLGSALHALEPGRDYLLGSADDCDLRVTGALPHHAQLCVRADGVTLMWLTAAEPSPAGAQRVGPTAIELSPGDDVHVGGEIATLTRDDGTALFVPIPALRQAAVARRMQAVRHKAAALRRSEHESFQNLIAHELRRAPWLALSLLLHLLLLLVSWLLTPTAEIGGQSVATIRLDVSGGAVLGDGPPGPPEVRREKDDDLVMQDPEPSQPDAPIPDSTGALPRRHQMPAENFPLAARKRSSSAGDGGSSPRTELGIGSGSFQQKVAELQESGLEIMFVFDSTGSMTRTIHDTKTTIVQMLGVLRLLVPDARVGLVTYRDNGRREEYLVRQVPLDLDYWRATNFVQFVVAEGGGDRPEDVHAGLTAAFRQDWRPGARRVVVLAGDAPPHRDSFTALLDEVRNFARDRRSFVHTLITSPDRAGDDTHDFFERIARAGRGTCEPIQNLDRVLQRVLTLAFGREYDRDIQAVIRATGQEDSRVDVQSLYLVRVSGKPLIQALRQRPVPTTLWNALVRRPRRATTGILIDLLGDVQTPAHTRQAAAAALQVILELPVPPIDGETGEAPSPQRLERLRALLERLPE